MKIIFMGTPDFAVAALEAIVKAGYEVACVVTQPDRPKGRSREMQYTPVKECALKYDIPVFQPVKVKAPEAVAVLADYKADLYVVAAFGQILSQEILDLPRFGCINIHASLLPKYRGAAPIQRALMDGEQETGITIMRMDAGIDTGDMLLKTVVPISEADTGDSLHDKLSQAGAKLITEAIPKLEAGELTGVKQDDAKASYAGMLQKSMGKIDWERPAAELERLVRALNSWPSAFTFLQGRTLKIWDAWPLTESQADEGRQTTGSASEAQEYKTPGCITEVGKDFFQVRTGDGELRIFAVQLEGKKKMPVREFLLGNPLKAGMKLGEA